MCHVLKPPSGGWCFLRSRKVSMARNCHPAQGTPVNKLQEHRNSFPLFHLSLIVFLNLPPCEVSLGWRGTFHLARRGGGFPWYTQRKRDMVVCHFFSIWKDRAERRWGRWVWPASKESKAKWRNTGVEEPSLSSIVKHFHWDTSKQKALISSGISRYRKTTEELGQSWADLPTARGGMGKCSCPWDEGCLCWSSIYQPVLPVPCLPSLQRGAPKGTREGACCWGLRASQLASSSVSVLRKCNLYLSLLCPGAYLGTNCIPILC